jgi:hypothetical protein
VQDPEPTGLPAGLGDAAVDAVPALEETASNPAMIAFGSTCAMTALIATSRPRTPSAMALNPLDRVLMVFTSSTVPWSSRRCVGNAPVSVTG